MGADETRTVVIGVGRKHCCWKLNAVRRLKNHIAFDLIGCEQNVGRRWLFQSERPTEPPSCSLETGLTVSFVLLFSLASSSHAPPQPARRSLSALTVTTPHCRLSSVKVSPPHPYITNIITIFSKFICWQYVHWFSYQLNVNFGLVSRLRCCWSVSQVNHSHSVISCRHWANNDVFYRASMEDYDSFKTSLME